MHNLACKTYTLYTRAVIIKPLGSRHKFIKQNCSFSITPNGEMIIYNMGKNVGHSQPQIMWVLREQCYWRILFDDKPFSTFEYWGQYFFALKKSHFSSPYFYFWSLCWDSFENQSGLQFLHLFWHLTDHTHTQAHTPSSFPFDYKTIAIFSTLGLPSRRYYFQAVTPISRWQSQRSMSTSWLRKCLAMPATSSTHLHGNYNNVSASAGILFPKHLWMLKSADTKICG